jgi:cell wall assembly regulator SMI1
VTATAARTVLELAPAAPPEDLQRLEDELGLALPRELRATLELTARIDGSALESIDVTGRTSRMPPERKPGLLRRVFG